VTASGEIQPDPDELLRKHNPVLVILPQDFERSRPWRSWCSPSKLERGDYHPCSAKFFLSYVFVRSNPRPWTKKPTAQPPSPEPLGLEALRELVLQTDRDATLEWEMDIAPIESQRPGRAWSAYRNMVNARPKPFERVVYGRCVPYRDRIALEYWYLYAYNDAGNYHEGDWEMIAIELDASGTPVRAGYSSHGGGSQREWKKVEKRGDRPLAYVARGSHAAYFKHRKGGHRTRSVQFPKGLPWLVERILGIVQRLIHSAIVWLRFHDFTPTHPDIPGNEEWNRGTFVCPSLKILPQLDEVDGDSRYWWMKIRCRWGSRHSRLRGTAAPSPPWEKPKWDAPLEWLADLD
jgi:hypothetical protein